jgi:hypothetical protein
VIFIFIAVQVCMYQNNNTQLGYNTKTDVISSAQNYICE